MLPVSQGKRVNFSYGRGISIPHTSHGHTVRTSAIATASSYAANGSSDRSASASPSPTLNGIISATHSDTSNASSSTNASGDSSPTPLPLLLSPPTPSWQHSTASSGAGYPPRPATRHGGRIVTPGGGFENDPDETMSMAPRMSSRTHFCLMRPVSLVTLITGLAYLLWKTATIMVLCFPPRPPPPPACLMFLLCEWFIFLSSLMLIVELARPARDREPTTLPPGGPFPSVAIFICCCNEPRDVIQDTVRGAMNQDYPPENYSVWVLDDGGDDRLKDWVNTDATEVWGFSRLHYLRRQKIKGVPHHFKAGNINHGLSHVQAEYVAVLDADMIPNRR